MSLLAALADRAAYVVAVLLAGLGLFVLVDDRNLVRKVLGLNLFQTGVFLVFVAAAVRAGGRSPLVVPDGAPYANPLPQVLVLTAIVVGVAVTAVAAALVVRIHDEHGTVRADELPTPGVADAVAPGAVGGDDGAGDDSGPASDPGVTGDDGPASGHRIVEDGDGGERR